MNRTSRHLVLVLLGAVMTTAAAAPVAAREPAETKATPSHSATPQEHRNARTLDIEDIVARAKPFIVEGRGRSAERREPAGTEIRIDGALPASAAATQTAAPAAPAIAQNGLWTGAYNTNPNLQVGKLYFDRAPGAAVDWAHCSATVVASENQSMLYTAGHCVYSPDPDKNGVISGNGFWHQSLFFCPGYEYGCKLGYWDYRQMSTTDSWFYGSGAQRLYDWSDDAAVVLLYAHPVKGKVAKAMGSQGIIFNQAAGLTRHAFGYPAADYRFPEYAYNGEDLIYCNGRDASDGKGHLLIPCTMTGGASGGGWIISPNASWIGYVNGVNSHKTLGTNMGSPYFGNAELNLYNYWRAR